MTSDNAIAVLLPVYAKDSPTYLATAIQSIDQQTYHGPIDIIFCIDGDIPRDLYDLCKQHSSSICLQLKTNQGLAANLNQGLDYAFLHNYSLIARMDADDIALPDRFQQQSDYLISHPLIDVVGGAISIINEHDTPSGKIIHYPQSHDDCLRFFKYRDPVAHPAVMFRRRYFEKAGIYNPSYKKDQDTELWSRGFLNHCCFANVPDIVLQFRQTNDLFKRRSNIKKSLIFLQLRLKINKTLGFGFISNGFAFSYFLLMMMPSFVKKCAYRLLR